MAGGIDKQGHYLCFFCDGIVNFEGSDMAEDIYPDSDPTDLLHYMKCSRCGAEYEIVQHTQSDSNVVKDELQLRKKMLK